MSHRGPIKKYGGNAQEVMNGKQRLITGAMSMDVLIATGWKGGSIKSINSGYEKSDAKK
jgi:hypothetical protein